MDAAPPARDEIAPHAQWIATPHGPAMTWVSAPGGSRPRSGVVVLPPVGYQWWNTHRTMRTLAERLARQGHRVARLDYVGTGDSAGDQWDRDRLTAWRDSARAAVADLRAQGCDRIVLVGARLGATLALLDGAALGVDAVVVWAPVTSGRRWVREIRMLGQPVPPERDPLGGGTVTTSGVVLSADTLAEVSALSAGDVDAPPAPRVAVVDAAPDPKLVEHLVALGCDAEALPAADGHLALEVPAEEAVVPQGVVEAIAGWIGPGGAFEGAPTPPEPARAVLPWRGGVVAERVVRLGAPALTAVVTTSPANTLAGPTVLFLNTGSEPHVGPGRAWVELARTLALRGCTCVRADWRGWGESPDDGHAPGRPYDAHAVTDTVALVEALEAEGHEQIVLVGLCASAWVVLRAVLERPVAGVVALNPQMYWQPGDPVEATLAQTRQRRTQEIADIAAGAAAGRWDAEDEAGDRQWAAQWLDELAALDVPITLLFAEGDDGVEFLTTRHARRLRHARAAGVRIVELPEIDHPLHRAWTRDTVADAIAEAAANAPSPQNI